MDQKTLQVVADLLLAAVPTMLLVVVLHFYLKAFLFRPLEKVIAQRNAATQGAVDQARLSLERAESKAQEYETALRRARGEILREQDVQRQALREEQSKTIAEAKASANRLIEDARQKMHIETATARRSLRGQADSLATQITDAVLAGSRG